jgi:hypothetical protein
VQAVRWESVGVNLNNLNNLNNFKPGAGCQVRGFRVRDY